jgi:dethiobiotin synthetase
MAGILVTGTDTGVGKTVVACAVAAGLVERGVAVAVWKPVETGVAGAPPEGTDAERLARASGRMDPIDAICPYRFHAPLAPAIAARLEGTTVDVDRLGRLYAQRAQEAEIVVVEGAGGLLVPLADRVTYVELARRLGLPLVIVVPNRLGAINHAALTARVAAVEGLAVVGFVLNAPHPRAGSPASGSPPPDDPAATNRDAIVELTGLPCLGELPHAPPWLVTPARLGRALDLETIVHAARHGTAARAPGG